MEHGVLDAVARGVGPRPRDEPRLALDADDFARRARDGQRKIAEPAKKIEHAILRPDLQRLDRPRDQARVHRRIDLHEVGGLKREFEPVLGQTVMQIRRRAAQRVHRVVIPGLQIDAYAVSILERRERRQIRLAERIEIAQHQHGHGIGDRDFDLRDALARLQAADQRFERRDQPVHRRREDLATLERGDVGLGALAKPDQHLAAFEDVFDAEPRAAPIRPGRPLQGRQPLARLDPPDAREIVHQFARFGGDLRLGRQMLQRASAADAEVRTARRDAISRRLEHLEQLRLVVRAMPPRALIADFFAGQRARDERGLRFANHPRTVVIERGDDALLGRRGEPIATHHAGQAARNSARCGSGDSPSSARTRAISLASSVASRWPRMCSKCRNTSQVLSTSVSQ